MLLNIRQTNWQSITCSCLPTALFLKFGGVSARWRGGGDVKGFIGFWLNRVVYFNVSRNKLTATTPSLCFILSIRSPLTYLRVRQVYLKATCLFVSFEQLL